MKFKKDYLWPLIGIAAVIFSVMLLLDQLRDISYEDLVASVHAVPVFNWIMALACTVMAFVALAGYDQLALRHLRHKIPFSFVTATSFATYALAHNIGASVVSGAVVRYRAYASKGLSGSQVGVLVAFCSFTFTLASITLGGLVLLISPKLLNRFLPDFPLWGSYVLAVSMLGLVGLYVLGSALRLPALKIRNFRLEYPRLRIVWQQLFIGPLEILSAAGIIYFALPAESNPGYVVVLGIFLASFSAALLSHAPGGLGVLEVMFFLALPNMDQADLLTALLIFRVFYFLIPLAISIAIVVLFERSQLLERFNRAAERITNKLN